MKSWRTRPFRGVGGMRSWRARPFRGGKRVEAWRRSRPFWGGLFIVVAGVELLSIPFAVNALPVAVMFGTVGAAYLIALIMILAGVLVWFQPRQRVFLGLVATLLSMASFVYSNLGGFLIGMLLGLLGGTLSMAWTPLTDPYNRVDTATLRTVRRYATRLKRPPTPPPTPTPKLREPTG